MPVRDATADDLDEICSLIGELATYEQLADEVVLEREAMARHLFGSSPAARVAIAEVARPGAPPRALEPAGFALWYPTFSTFLERCLCELKSQRGQVHGPPPWLSLAWSQKNGPWSLRRSPGS